MWGKIPRDSDENFIFFYCQATKEFLKSVKSRQSDRKLPSATFSSRQCLIRVLQVISTNLPINKQQRLNFRKVFHLKTKLDPYFHFIQDGNAKNRSPIFFLQKLSLISNISLTVLAFPGSGLPVRKMPLQGQIKIRRPTRQTSVTILKSHTAIIYVHPMLAASKTRYRHSECLDDQRQIRINRILI